MSIMFRNIFCNCLIERRKRWPLEKISKVKHFEMDNINVPVIAGMYMSTMIHLEKEEVSI